MLQLLTRPRTALALLAAALVGLMLLACGGEDPTATATMAPTNPPAPTAVPTATMPPPTATSAPTATPVPTATPRPAPTARPTPTAQHTRQPAPTDPGMGMMEPAALSLYQGTGYTIMVPEGWEEQTPSASETVYQAVSEDGVVASLTEVPLPPGLETGEEAADALLRFVEGGSLWDFQAIEQDRQRMMTASGVPSEFLVYLADGFSRPQTIFVLVPAVTDFGLIAAYQVPLTENPADAEAALDTAIRSFTSLEVAE